MIAFIFVSSWNSCAENAWDLSVNSSQHINKYSQDVQLGKIQLTLAFLKSTRETLEKGMKYDES